MPNDTSVLLKVSIQESVSCSSLYCRRKAKTHKNICESKRVHVKTYLAHTRFTYLVGMSGKCACYISLPLSLLRYSLFRHFGVWDCCNSDSDNEFRLHMNGCSDPSSSTMNNLREWGFLRNEYAENIGKKSVY